MNTTADGVGVSGGHRNGGPPLRVLIADDDPATRRVMRDALQGAGAVVVGEADDPTQAVELALHLRPDVVLMDMPMIDELRKPPPQGLGSRPVDSKLTDREWAVLDLLDAGLEACAIAERLVVSIDTVRSHVKSLHRKLGVHSRRELVGAIRALRAPASPQLRGR